MGATVPQRSEGEQNTRYGQRVIATSSVCMSVFLQLAFVRQQANEAEAERGTVVWVFLQLATATFDYT